MARTNKVGIDYFPLDVDFFQDDKIQLIEAEFGVKGGYIALRLLCKIYKEGYFYKWGSDECLLFIKNIGVEGVSRNTVDEIVKGLVKRGFFDESVYNRFQILTSSGIQKRYFEITKRYKEVTVIKEYLLTDCINDNNVNIISINANNNQQKKLKEIEIKNKYPFCDFWDLYDKKIGDKKKLEKKWNKLSIDIQKSIMLYIPKYKLSQPDKQFRKNPETFLNNESWNDELIERNEQQNEEPKGRPVRF